jgi:hypothetical protein
MVWGEVSSFIKNKQDHSQQLDMMELQLELDDRKHERDMAIMNRSAELGIQKINVKADAEVNVEEAEAFTEAMKHAFKPTGFSFVDISNAMVRSSFAYLCWALWALKLYGQSWVMDDFDRHLMAVIIGFFFADRTLKKHGR